MRRFTSVVLLLAMVLGGGALAAGEQVSSADRSKIRQVVESQLQAFQRDEGARAFSYASPGIQAMFQTADRFMQMVRTGYRPVYRPRSVEFGEVIEFRGQPTQLVTLVAPDGDVVAAYYVMEQQPDGIWRIDGCFLREAPSV